MSMKEILKFLMSLLLMFLFLIFSVSFFVNTKLLSGNFYKSSLDKSKYYEYLPQEIDKGYKILSISTTIPEEVFKASLGDNFFREQTNKNIDNTISYMTYKTDKITSSLSDDTFSKDVYNNIEKYVDKVGIKPTSEVKKQLDKASKDFVEITENHSNLFNVDAVEKYEQFQKFRKGVYLLDKALIPVSILILVFIGMLFGLNKKNPRKVLLWIGSSLIPAGIIVLVPSLFALITRIPYRYGIALSYLKEALCVFTLGFIKYFIVTGSAFILIGILLLYLYSTMQSESRR